VRGKRALETSDFRGTEVVSRNKSSSINPAPVYDNFSAFPRRHPEQSEGSQRVKRFFASGSEWDIT
jgi:hypothetical protein